jgi:hypothetical protein
MAGSSHGEHGRHVTMAPVFLSQGGRRHYVAAVHHACVCVVLSDSERWRLWLFQGGGTWRWPWRSHWQGKVGNSGLTGGGDGARLVTW